MKWPPFKLGEVVFDLSHLDDFDFDVVVPEQKGKPEQRYRITVRFSRHCFTSTAYAVDGTWPRDREYLHGNDNEKEVRVFDDERYELSKRLPDIIRAIGNRNCYHSDRGNFFIFEGIDGRHYHIFFEIRLADRRGTLYLEVISAYVPDDNIPLPRSRKAPPIRFSVIAYNTKHGKPIKRPD